ncbi:MAG: TatD family hydrolase [Candidatus Nanoarchaeia archaeon]|nr:TatD family hydrolase [Candidatus Nanoarchaeia archaeon]MDD5587580.1 TatD family hydrolase [Candidatus Nanoarchaeia archaeon]
MLVDSHCHLDFFPEEEISVIVKRFPGIIIQNAVDINSMKKSLIIAKKYSNVKLAFGVYPTRALELSEKDFEKALSFIRENKDNIIALGEIGLEYKESQEREKQIINLKKLLKLAEEIKKPLIIHSRKAELEVLELLKNSKVKIVLHCFNGNTTAVRTALEYGFYFSVPTNISTSKNLKKLVKIVPIDRILTETDAPYLSPIKGQRNEPLNVKHTIKVIAEIKHITEENVEEQIYRNYKLIFE